MPTPHPQPAVALPLLLIDTAFINSGSSGVYLYKGAPCTNIDPSVPMIYVGTVTGQSQQSSAECNLALPQLPKASTKGHILLNFTQYLIGVCTFYNDDCTVVFTNYSVTVLDPQDKTILTGCRKRTCPKLWRFSLWPQLQPDSPPGSTTASLKDFSAYDLPIVESIVCYLHAANGFLF